MSGLRQSLLALGFGAVMLSACSSVSPAPQPPSNNNPAVPDPYLSVYDCLDLDIQAPSSVSEGDGLTAKLTLTNTCSQAFGLPLSNATSIKDGEDSGVEINFQLLVTELQDPSGGATVLWDSTDPNPDAVTTRSDNVLEPGSSIERELTWSGQLDDGDTLTSGEYLIAALFYYVPNVTNNPADEYVVLSQSPLEIIEP